MASRAPAHSPIKDRKHCNQWPHVCTHCFGCVAVSHYPTILLKEHASSLEIIPSRMAFVILTLSGKQTVNAFTLVLRKTEDRIYLLGLQERHSDTFTRCFLDQEHKG